MVSRNIYASIFITVTALSKIAVVDALNGWPQVLALRLAEGQREAHHTSFYKIDVGFAVRRGQPFNLILTVDEPLGDNQAFAFTANEAQGTNVLRPSIVKKLGGSEYLVNVSSCSKNARVGRIDNLVVGVKKTDGARDGEAPVYVYPFPIYLLFNAWSESDPSFMRSASSREEYLFKEYGNVYDGFVDDYITMKWYYGQSQQVALDAAVHLLRAGVKHGFITTAAWSDPVLVAQTISRYQGMMRKAHSQDILVGTEDALLEGDWGQHQEDWNRTTDPTLWISTIDILDRWKRTQKPTRFGQCWVFAALQTTLMRALGVPSRQLSAFNSPIDRSFTHDKHHRMHHVVDYYYDRNGKTVWNDGTIWNFHSWIDIHLNRNTARHSGWQAVDGTPPGNIGPSSVNAVYDLVEDLPFNDSSMISNVHSTVRRFLVTCGKNYSFHDHLNGCKVERMLSYDAKGLQRMLSSRTLLNGSLGVHDITKDYVNHKVDAFIPYEPGTGLNNMLIALPDTGVETLSIHITKAVVCGEDLRFKIHMKGRADGGHKQHELRYTVELVSDKGERLRMIEDGVRHGHRSGEVIIRKERYLEKVMIGKHLRINAMAFTTDAAVGFATKAVRLTSPKLDLKLPRSVKAGEDFVVQVAFNNQYRYHTHVRNVCLAVESHEFNVPRSEVCTKLARGKNLLYKVRVRADTSRPGVHDIVASLRGDYLPLIRAHKELFVVDTFDSELTVAAT